ncbi:hypothetical protein J41TS12_13080 [Paenibacillus antibioticophila]|uniref:SLH domain-containing protein n=1 Tax=Paenibacillus antibioticophila TaxID=1274374 RepID=A0A920CH72_9BACL|nr:S-layer homology domain-containing protein [Paenibacillus antibioticophila]GIO36447.1 hypothetical protein J41TS12_13080 [Paenibacillus antibioticophila]
MNRRRKNTILSVIMVSVLMTSAGSQAVYAESTISTGQSVNSVAQSSSLPFKDIKGHWAEQSIVRGYEKGYIESTSTSKFEPNEFITRQEFVTMLMKAQNRSIENENAEGAYIYAARDQGLFDAGQFVYDRWGDPEDRDSTSIYLYTWDDPIRKHQLAHIAVRALGKEEEIQDDIYDAIRYGLIGAGADGKLNPAEKTTRAQAAVVIDRILRIGQGESFPVDQKTLAAAEKVKLAQKDPWGRAIRTTNLPKNYQDFPYIQEEWPNEMYNLNHEFKTIHSKITPVQFTDLRSWASSDVLVYNTDDVADRAEDAEQYVNQLINVDYTKLDQAWMDKIKALTNPEGLDWVDRQMDKMLKEYVASAKKNKVQVRGSATAEPSIMFVNGETFVRVHFTFKATSFTDRKKIFFDQMPSFYTHKNFYDSVVIKKNVEYEVYANIAFVNRSYGGGMLSTGAIDQFAFLFEDAIVKEKK